MKKSLFAGIALLLVCLGVAYYQHSYSHDKTQSAQIYQQLLVIDKQLDSLQESAALINHQKQVNLQIFSIAKNISKDTFMANKDALLTAVANATFIPLFQSKIESEIQATTNANLKLQLHLIKNTLHELKYSQNQQIEQFNQQIAQINSQLIQINQEIMQIKNTNLHDLELAKLKYISHKLSITAEQLNAAFYKQVVDDILDTLATDDAEK